MIVGTGVSTGTGWTMGMLPRTAQRLLDLPIADPLPLPLPEEPVLEVPSEEDVPPGDTEEAPTEQGSTDPDVGTGSSEEDATDEELPVDGAPPAEEPEPEPLREWEPGIYLTKGERFTYRGRTYECTQSHRTSILRPPSLLGISLYIRL